jgi:hypothetical protein
MQSQQIQAIGDERQRRRERKKETKHDPGTPWETQHIVFECPALHDLRARCNSLFRHSITTTSKRLFMWQDDLVQVAQFIIGTSVQCFRYCGCPISLVAGTM